eukprot:PhM_4_TR17451/c0_g1_i3/m.18808
MPKLSDMDRKVSILNHLPIDLVVPLPVVIDAMRRSRYSEVLNKRIEELKRKSTVPIRLTHLDLVCVLTFCCEGLSVAQVANVADQFQNVLEELRVDTCELVARVGRGFVVRRTVAQIPQRREAQVVEPVVETDEKEEVSDVLNETTTSITSSAAEKTVSPVYETDTTPLDRGDVPPAVAPSADLYDDDRTVHDRDDELSQKRLAELIDMRAQHRHTVRCFQGPIRTPGKEPAREWETVSEKKGMSPRPTLSPLRPSASQNKVPAASSCDVDSSSVPRSSSGRATPLLARRIRTPRMLSPISCTLRRLESISPTSTSMKGTLNTSSHPYPIQHPTTTTRTAPSCSPRHPNPTVTPLQQPHRQQFFLDVPRHSVSSSPTERETTTSFTPRSPSFSTASVLSQP